MTTTTTTTSTTTTPFDVDAVRYQLSELDAILERVLDANELKIGELRRCEHVESIGGPHPGCDEFAPPVDWQCDLRPTKRIIVRDVTMAGNPEACEFPWDLAPDVAVLLTCDDHAQLVLDDPWDDGTEIVRVEQLSSVGDGSELQGVLS
jgi:hypothetical protein